MNQIYKRVQATVKAVNPKKRQVRMTLTTMQVDRDGDVVLPMGAKLDAYLANPIVLFGHMGMFPVANMTELTPKDMELEGVIEFFTKEESPLAERLFQLYSKGKMRAGSIGFMPITISDKAIMAGQTGRTYEEWELLEFSLVSVPSNRQALTTEREANLKSVMKTLALDEASDPEEMLNDLFGEENKTRKSKRTLVLCGAPIGDDEWVISVNKSAWEGKSLQADAVSFEEDLTILEKSGRVLSQKNFSRIEQAKLLLEEVVQSAQKEEEDQTLEDDEKAMAELLNELGPEMKDFQDELSLLTTST